MGLTAFGIVGLNAQCTYDASFTSGNGIVGAYVDIGEVFFNVNAAASTTAPQEDIGFVPCQSLGSPVSLQSITLHDFEAESSLDPTVTLTPPLPLTVATTLLNPTSILGCGSLPLGDYTFVFDGTGIPLSADCGASGGPYNAAISIGFVASVPGDFLLTVSDAVIGDAVSLGSYTLTFDSTEPGIEPNCNCNMDAGTFHLTDANDGTDFGAASAVGANSTIYLCESDNALNNGASPSAATHNPTLTIDSNEDWYTIYSSVGLTECPVGVYYDVFDEEPTDEYFNNNNGYDGTPGVSPDNGLLTPGTDPADVENTSGGNEDYWITTTASTNLSLLGSTSYTHPELCPQMANGDPGAFDMNLEDLQHFVHLNEIQVADAAGACNGETYEFEMVITGGLPDYDINGGTQLPPAFAGEAYTVTTTHSTGSGVTLSAANPTHGQTVIVRVDGTMAGETVTIDVIDGNGCTVETITHNVAAACGCVATGGTWN